jgi:hypothetical protein
MRRSPLALELDRLADEARAARERLQALREVAEELRRALDRLAPVDDAEPARKLQSVQ